MAALLLSKVRNANDFLLNKDYSNAYQSISDAIDVIIANNPYLNAYLSDTQRLRDRIVEKMRTPFGFKGKRKIGSRKKRGRPAKKSGSSKKFSTSKKSSISKKSSTSKKRGRPRKH